jgi:hypothetical protein
MEASDFTRIALSAYRVYDARARSTTTRHVLPAFRWTVISKVFMGNIPVRPPGKVDPPQNKGSDQIAAKISFKDSG